jgi:hypothetical protein
VHAVCTRRGAAREVVMDPHVATPSVLEPPLLVLILLLNLFVLGSSRLRAVIGASALQGIALGVVTLFRSASSARSSSVRSAPRSP